MSEFPQTEHFMKRTTLAGALTLLVAAAACGDRRNDDLSRDSLAPGDSLVPIADAPALTDTTRPAPPAETVFVQPPSPRPTASRPSPSRPTTGGSTAPAPAPAPSRGLTVDAGTTIATTATEQISSKTHKAGDVVRVRVASDILGANGNVAIPAGSVVSLSIVEIAGAANRGERGTLVMSASSVSINGTSYPLNARVTDYAFKMDAGKIGAEQVATTGAGAIAGAVVGRVIGGKTGTAVGAVGGAAAGAAVAAKKADRDIVVESGNSVTLVLREDFRRS